MKTEKFRKFPTKEKKNSNLGELEIKLLLNLSEIKITLQLKRH